MRRVRTRLWNLLRHPAVQVLLALFACHAVARATPSDGLPPPERYTLGNGLEVILQRDSRQPLVAVVVSYRAGSRDDPSGYRGLAHLVEHMTYRGSRHVAELEMLGALERAGASANAETAPDYTAYYAVLPNAQLPLALWLESERMAFTLEAMSERSLRLERAIVVNESLQRRGIGSIVPELIFRSAYPERHPYHHVADAERDESSLRLDHVRYFYQQSYRPDNATLTVVGSFDRERAREEIERYFAPIRAPEGAARRAPAPRVTLSGQETLRVISPTDRSSLRMLWTVPCGIQECGAEVQLLTTWLAGTDESPLLRALVGKGLAVSASLDVSVLESQLQVALYAEGALGREARGLHTATDEVLRNAQASLPSSAEVANAKILLQTELYAGFEPLLPRALTLTHWRAMGDPARLYDPTREAARLGGLTPSQLVEAARRFLPLDRRIVVYETPARGAAFEGVLRTREGSASPTVEQLAAQ